MSNFQQLLFISPKQDTIFRDLLQQSGYDFLLDHFQSFQETDNVDPFYATAFENQTETANSDGSAMILYNEFNQAWIAFVRNGKVYYFTNDLDYADKLPLTMQQKFGDLPVEYVNIDNAKKYEDKGLAMFPLLQEDFTSTFIKRQNRNYQIRAYRDLGVESVTKHGNFMLLLNRRYQEIETKLILKKGSKGMNVFFVGDDYEEKFVDYRPVDEDINFNGQILQSVYLSPSDPTQTISVPVGGVQKLSIVVSGKYEDKEPYITFSDVDLIK